MIYLPKLVFLPVVQREKTSQSLLVRFIWAFDGSKNPRFVRWKKLLAYNRKLSLSAADVK